MGEIHTVEGRDATGGATTVGDPHREEGGATRVPRGSGNAEDPCATKTIVLIGWGHEAKPPRMRAGRRIWVSIQI